jgi:polysaccharide deacetylase 2 family uncharacterized protein YibQ
MFGKLTKVKIIVLIGLFIALLTKGSSLVQYLIPYDDVTPDSNSQVFIKEASTNRSINQDVSKVSILITNLGLQKENLKLAKESDKKICLGISAYSDNISNIVLDILSTGRATALLLPTQSINGSISDPGPSALLIESSISENARKFKSFLSKIPSSEVGVYLAADSAFSIQQEYTLNCIRLLEDNVKYFKFFAYYDVEGGNIMTSLIKSSSIAKKAIVIHSIIDNTLTEESIISSLDNLAELSLKNGSVAIGSISATKISLESLEKWLQANEDRVELVQFVDLLQETNS